LKCLEFEGMLSLRRNCLALSAWSVRWGVPAVPQAALQDSSALYIERAKQPGDKLRRNGA